MVTRLHLRRCAAFAVAFAFALAGGASIAGAEQRSSAVPRSAVEAFENPSAGPVSSVDAEQAAAFELLRGAPEAVPAQVRADLESAPLSKALGLNLSLAQGVVTPASSVPVWIVPGDGFLCIWLKDPVDGAAVSCDPTSVALKNGLIVTLQWPDIAEHTIVGMVPDGAPQVTLSGGAVAAHTLKTRSGVFGAAADDAATVAFRADRIASAVTIARPRANPTAFGAVTRP